MSAYLPGLVALRLNSVLQCTGLVLLEVSVVVFLLQGYVTSGREVSKRFGKSILYAHICLGKHPSVTFVVYTVIASAAYLPTEHLQLAVDSATLSGRVAVCWYHCHAP